MNFHETQAYWIFEPGVGALQTERFPTKLEAGFSLVETIWSAVSTGTERLVGLGLVPATCNQALACRYMAGSFDLPLKYGYCLIGRGREGRLAGKNLFVMHPHQALVAVRDEDVTVLPESLPLRRAALIPNLETALNGVWDAELQVSERCCVIGAGSVGLLVAYVLWRQTGQAPRLVEQNPERRAFAARLPFGAGICAPDSTSQEEFQVAFHTTGNPKGLQRALEQVGFEGRVIEMSWYGEKPVTLELGTHFHYGRKKIIASQVGHIAVSHRSSHGYSDRLREVLALLDQQVLDALLGSPVSFESLPSLMNSIYRGEPTAPLPLVQYPSEPKEL